jgi:hypothetical protein
MKKLVVSLSFMLFASGLSFQAHAFLLTIDPDNISGVTHDQNISNAFTSVTLSSTYTTGIVYAKDASLSSEWGFSSTGDFVFGNEGDHGGYLWNLGWLDDPSDDHKFRADFDVPVNMVSLDGIASDPIDEWTLEAYDSSDILIDSAVTPLLGEGTVGTLTVTSASWDIAYIMAYGSGVSEGCTEGGPGWSNGVDLDNLIFNIPPNVSIDIKPGSCPNPLNIKSKGVLPVAILGTEDFDVTTIDPASVSLEGVAPIRWAIEDVATPYEEDLEGCDDCYELVGDGYDDLTLKFESQEVVTALGEVEDGDCLLLELTGNLQDEFGGNPIGGEDFVLVLKKEKK